MSMTEDTETGEAVEAPTEPGWYAYSGGGQVMIFHLRMRPNFFAEPTPQWSAHLDNGDAADCVWGYIEQALGVWDLVPLVPRPSPVLSPPETLAALVEQWGQESIYDAFIARWPEAAATEGEQR